MYKFILILFLFFDFGCPVLNKIGPIINNTKIQATNMNGPTCPPKMVYVSGDYCFNLQHTCLEWKDPPNGITRRCQKYSEKSVCKSKTIKLNFCIDKEEYTDLESVLPKNNVSWTEAKWLCETDGKRLCAENEWTLACEGNERYPYPYGYIRNSEACNIDQMNLLDSKGNMMDLRDSVNLNPMCKSPFGVHNMTGNVDEFVIIQNAQYPKRALLKGGWWSALRNRCRPATGDHDEFYKDLQTGFRCCKST